MGRAALIVGASRGIGLAITRALLEDQSWEKVYATCRESSGAAELAAIADARLSTLPVDVTREDHLQALGDRLKTGGHALRLVIHCAGILHEGPVQPEKALKQCRSESLSRMFEVNSIAPLMLAREIIPLLPRRGRSHFAALSAMVGSIADNRLGGWYGYRASKAALNQLLRTLAVECRRTHPELCVTAIHPGTTDTDLSRPFQSNVKPGKLYPPEQSARRIIRVVTGGEPQDSGRFMNWDGQPIPW